MISNPNPKFKRNLAVIWLMKSSIYTVLRKAICLMVTNSITQWFT